MSSIEQNLAKILSAVYGEEVRGAIHDAIHDCYEDGKAGAVDLVAREQIANLVANEGTTEKDSELVDIRVGANGVTYTSAGGAVRAMDIKHVEKLSVWSGYFIVDTINGFVDYVNRFNVDSKNVHFSRFKNIGISTSIDLTEQLPLIFSSDTQALLIVLNTDESTIRAISWNADEWLHNTLSYNDIILFALDTRHEVVVPISVSSENIIVNNTNKFILLGSMLCEIDDSNIVFSRTSKEGPYLMNRYKDNYVSVSLPKTFTKPESNMLYYIDKIGDIQEIEPHEFKEDFGTELGVYISNYSTFVLTNSNVDLSIKDDYNLYHSNINSMNRAPISTYLNYININRDEHKIELLNSSNVYIIVGGVYTAAITANTLSEINYNTHGSTAEIIYLDTTNWELSCEIANDYTKGSYNFPLFSIYGNEITPLCLSPYSLYVDGKSFSEYELNLGNAYKNIQLLMSPLSFDTSNPTKIVLGGDSITHGVGGTGFAQNGDTIIGSFKRNPNGYCWAKLFKEYMESGYSCTVTNNGCTGTNSQFWNNNKASLIPSDTDIFILTIGTNDRNRDVGSQTPTLTEKLTTLYNNLQSIINYCNGIGCNIILSTPIPAAKSNQDYTDDGQERFIAVYQIAQCIQKVAADNNIECIDLYNDVYYYFFDKDLKFEDYLVDGLHPGDEMYRIMFYQYLKGLHLSPSYIMVPEP